MQVKLFFFGDSICFGQGVSLHEGWVPRVSSGLEQFARDNDFEILVANSAVNGRITRQALEHMPFDIQSHAPDLLVVQFGLNDCNYWLSDRGLPRVSPKAFEANLEEIISRATNFGVQKIILNTNHPTGRDQDLLPSTDTTYENSNRRYNHIIRKVGANSDKSFVVLNDIETIFNEYTEGDRGRLLKLLLPEPDLLHLSKSGHDVYVDCMLPKIKRLLLQFVRNDYEKKSKKD